ncbi:MAG: hypothetical protein IAE96_00620 [Chitinophagaceae bacterium]|nr:hypothetical protein [Chitinophagaceae bacterium]
MKRGLPFITVCLLALSMVSAQGSPVSRVCTCSFTGTPPVVTVADFSLHGKLECMPAAGNQRRYVLKFDFFNKSNCVLNLLSVTVHGQTVEVPAFNTPPGGKKEGISLGFATDAGQSPPADDKLMVLVRYRLNDRKCMTAIEINYQPCK